MTPQDQINQATTYADSLNPLFNAIFNLTGSRVEERHERVAPALQQERRAVEADALTKAAGLKPASPTTHP